MADDKKPDSNNLVTALPVTAVLAMLASLFFTHSLPYQDERPSNHSVQARYADAQDVDARLWQDPFAAVEGASEVAPPEKTFIVANKNDATLQFVEAKQTADSLLHKPDQIYKGKTVTDKDEITILAVTLPGGPYQEDAEQRMRRRYAVLSALANQDAAPQDEQHIGYFHPESEMHLQKRVAFEWWSMPDDKKKVLLLWVDESSLLKYPAEKLKTLLCQAILKSPSDHIHYAVIGPNTSTLLRDMLNEVKDDKNNVSVVQCTDRPDDILYQASCQKELPQGIVCRYAVNDPNTSTLLCDLLNKVKSDQNRDPVTQCADHSDGNAAKSSLGKIKGQDIIYYSPEATATDKD